MLVCDPLYMPFGMNLCMANSKSSSHGQLEDPEAVCAPPNLVDFRSTEHDIRETVRPTGLPASIARPRGRRPSRRQASGFWRPCSADVRARRTGLSWPGSVEQAPLGSKPAQTVIFRRKIGIRHPQEMITSRKSPWQNPFAEWVIGSIRRERLNYVIVFSENHLREILKSYVRYYHESCPHLSLERSAPIPREVEPPSRGRVIAIPQVGNLHHLYKRAV